MVSDDAAHQQDDAEIERQRRKALYLKRRGYLMSDVGADGRPRVDHHSEHDLLLERLIREHGAR